MKKLKYHLAFLIVVGTISLSKSQTISFVDTLGNYNSSSLANNSTIKFANAKLFYLGSSSDVYKTRTLRSFNFSSIVATSEQPYANISIFPNPSSESVTITGSGQNAVVTLYDIAGKLLYKNQNYNGGSIDLSNFPKGVIVVSLLTSKSEIIKKIIKN